MICEGLLTTVDAEGQPHLAPMGPIIGDDWQTLVLRPFQSSSTFTNLVHSREGVFHVTDDVELIARAAIGQLEDFPRTLHLPGIHTPILGDACRYLVLRVTRIDDSHERAEIFAEVIQMGTLREFFGLCRAKHAVIEGAILATRTKILPAQDVFAQWALWDPLVEKTGGPAEKRAWNLVSEFLHAEYGRSCAQGEP